MAMDCRIGTKCYHLFGTNLLVMRLLDAYGCKHRLTACLLALCVVSIPWVHDQGEDVNPINLEMIHVLFRDLKNKGLLNEQDRGLIVSNEDKNESLENYIDLISYSKLETKRSDLKQDYDFAFTQKDVELTDSVLKVNGIMVVQTNDRLGASESFLKPPNYEIVYARQFEPRLETTIVAMRKTSLVHENKNEGTNAIPHRRLLGLTFEERKAKALKKLENVFLEPPSAASGKSITHYLPDLMGDSLENYPRRVFIDVNGDVGWFTKNYPTKNKKFEMYEVEATAAQTGGAASGEAAEVEISDWMKANVKKAEYVVMKAEAEVVEELMNNGAIGLVDELFLECRYQEGGKKMPYWKCLALYGLLRDEGVAVHQWWG